MPKELSPLGKLHAIQAQHAHDSRPVAKVGRFVTSLMQQDFGEDALAEAVASPHSIATYSGHLEALLPELPPFLSGETGKDILIATLENFSAFSRLRRFAEQVRPGQQEILRFWGENLTALSRLADTQEDPYNHDLANETFLSVLGSLMQHGTRNEKDAAKSAFYAKYHELFDEFTGSSLFTEQPIALPQAIYMVFDHEEFRDLRKPTLDRLHDMLDDRKTVSIMYRRQVPAGEFAQTYLRKLIKDDITGENNGVLADLASRLARMGIDRPEEVMEK